MSMWVASLIKLHARHYIVWMTMGVFAILHFQASVISAVVNDNNYTIVGTTYYGGYYDEQKQHWVIDNTNQCDRIASGEFTEASLDAYKDTYCDDDNGLGYLNDVPLHNTVSFAELSTNPNTRDYAALGDLPAGSKLEINYDGKCLVAEKRDVGQGGGPVNGYKRSIDLWWQTARSIGFTNGYDTVSVLAVPSDTPLTPLGTTTACTLASQPIASPVDDAALAPINNEVAADTTPHSASDERNELLLISLILTPIVAIILGVFWYRPAKDILKTYIHKLTHVR